MMNECRLTTEQLRELESELRRELTRLERSIASQEQSEHVVPFDEQLVTSVTSGAGEQAGLAVMLESRAHDRYTVVTNALKRIGDGTYGVCEGCQGAIPYGRLIAMPETALCVACGARA